MRVSQVNFYIKYAQYYWPLCQKNSQELTILSIDLNQLLLIQ